MAEAAILARHARRLAAACRGRGRPAPGEVPPTLSLPTACPREARHVKCGNAPVGLSPTCLFGARCVKGGNEPASAAIPRGARLPLLWLVSDPVRLPDPRRAAARLPRGAGVLARGLAPAVLAGLVALARRRGLVLLVAGDARAALAARAGLHLADRPPGPGLPAFLLARRSGAPGRLLTLAAHGSAAAAARARRLRPDLAFLSPIFATRSHPGAAALGPLRWAAAARRLGVPAVALGGVSARTAGRVPRRAAGLAAIDGLAAEAVAHPPHCLS